MKLRMPARPKLTSAHFIAVAALVISCAGSASAAIVITSQQIKDGTVTTKDVKNRTLLLKDFKPSERLKLKGAKGDPGTPGAPGAPGASGFSAAPAGTLIYSSKIHELQVSGAITLREYISLPFRTSVPLTETAPGRNIWFAPAADAVDAEESAVLCQGSAEEPNPAAGVLCVYIDGSSNITDGSVDAFAGLFEGDGAGADDSTGATIRFGATGAGPVTLRYVWAYKAP